MSHFGFSLEEVEAYNATLNNSNNSINQQITDKKAEYTAVYAKMGEMGVHENVYTNLTPEDLERSRAQLVAGMLVVVMVTRTNTSQHLLHFILFTIFLTAVEKRTHAYQTELARQRANDALCKEFAALVSLLLLLLLRVFVLLCCCLWLLFFLLVVVVVVLAIIFLSRFIPPLQADPFVQSFVEQKDTITNSKADLEEQLQYVNQRLNETREQANKLPAIVALHTKIEEAGITNNR